MKPLALPRRTVIIILCIISDYLITVNAHICEVGREKNQHNEWKWVLPYPDPCQCTKIIMGGMNTWTPIRPFDPVYVESPLLSDDITTIREHYGLTCNTESEAGATRTEAGTLDGTSEYTSSSTAGSTAEGSTSSVPSVRGESSRAISAEAGTSEHAGTTAIGSTAVESTKAEIETAPTSSISTFRSTTPKVCKEYLGMKNREIPDGDITASNYYFPRLPEKGRLYADTFWGCHSSRCKSEATTWIQADIGYQTYVSGVITQGDGKDSSNNAYWVTALKVSTFKMTTEDQQLFVTDGNGDVKVFPANTDRDTPVTSTFPNAVYARIVRITCVSKSGDRWQMRFEILGCKQAIVID